MSHQPKRPPRLIPFEKYGSPLWFVTFGTFDRLPILANRAVQKRFISFAEKNMSRGIAMGRYVIMPDHIHLFIRLAPDCELGATIGFLKKSLSEALKQNGCTLPYWQPGFFDHLLRSAASYSEKWAYVYQNPVRAGLVESADDWPYCGQVVQINY